jgi:hypothetical protein
MASGKRDPARWPADEKIEWESLDLARAGRRTVNPAARSTEASGSRPDLTGKD